MPIADSWLQQVRQDTITVADFYTILHKIWDEEPKMDIDFEHSDVIPLQPEDIGEILRIAMVKLWNTNLNWADNFSLYWFEVKPELEGIHKIVISLTNDRAYTFRFTQTWFDYVSQPENQELLHEELGYWLNDFERYML